MLSPFAFAQSTGVGVLSGAGNAYLNGSQLSNSNAVVAGDVIQTKYNGTASISGPGGSIAIEPNSIVPFQGPSVALDHGQISAATGQEPYGACTRLQNYARFKRFGPSSL